MPTVLITGCSSGLGLELAVEFANSGYEVVATMRNLDAASRIESRLSGAPLTRLHPVRLDVTDAPSVLQVVAEASSAHGPIDVLVNNAGIATVGAIEVLDEQLWRRSFDTNFFGSLSVTRAVLPEMRERGRGRIIFVGAIGALLNTPYFAAYGATKHALDCVAATLDVEMQPFGVRVMSVHPGVHQTAIMENLTADWDEGGPYEGATRAYAAGLSQRIEASPDRLEDLARIIRQMGEEPQPKERYVVSSGMGTVLAPLVDELEGLHERERTVTAGLQNNAAG